MESSTRRIDKVYQKKYIKQKKGEENMKTKHYISSMDGLPYYLNLEMVAGLTGLNYETVKRLCQRGELKASKLNKVWRVSQDDLKNHMNCKTN